MPSKDSAIIVDADVLNRDYLQRALETVIKAFGRVDRLVNGAGGNDRRATIGRINCFSIYPKMRFDSFSI